MLDWNTIIVLFGSIIGSGGFAAIVVKIIDVREKRKNKKDDIQQSRDIILMGLAASDLIRIMQDEIRKGETDMYTRKHVDKLYKAYKILNGNGIVDSLYSAYIMLKIKPEE